MMMMTTTMLMMRLSLMVKILSIEMSMKRGLNEGTLREILMTMRYLIVVNLTHTKLLVSKTLQTQSLPMHLLRVIFCKYLGKYG